VAGASQVISGMGTSDLSRMAGTGRPAVATRKGVNPNWLTSAFEAFDTDNDLALMKAQQVARQLNKEQQAQVAAGKPVFIDKPIAGSLKDAVAIFKEAKAARVPVFSSSSLRFGKGTQAVRAGSVGRVVEAQTQSPASLEPSHPDLFWYGIHGVESLFTVMGTGCESVRRGKTADGKIEVVGTWKGGRTGTFREVEGYQGKAQGSLGSADVGGFDGYAPLVAEAVKFFLTQVAPVPIEETLELFAFMEAADESKRRGGAEVKLSEVVEAAKKR
jgi:hypothetical protein